MMRERHNAILDRIKKVTSKDIGTLFIDQAIPEAPGILRPDLVAKTDTTITIVDVTVPYESGPDAFNSTRAEKTQKYSELVEWAKTKYLQVHFEVLVVGSLGSNMHYILKIAILIPEPAKQLETLYPCSSLSIRST